MVLSTRVATNTDWNRIRNEWIPALRDGRYTQAESVLRRVNEDGTVGHCCLGVICDLYDPSGWGDIEIVDADNETVVAVGMRIKDFPEDDMSKEGGITYVMTDAGEYDLDDLIEVQPWKNGHFTLPTTLQTALGIPSSTGRIGLVDPSGSHPDDAPAVLTEMYPSLANMNDSGASFEEIADVLEYVCDHPDVYGFTT